MRTAAHIKNVRTWDSIEYKLTYYKDFDFSLFQCIDLKYKTKKGKYSYNDVIIMADTETAKSIEYPRVLDNYVVAWSMAFRAFNRNLVTLYGHKPSEFIECLKEIDEVAYVRFASVYRSFKDISTFMKELKKLQKKDEGKN